MYSVFLSSAEDSRVDILKFRFLEVSATPATLQMMSVGNEGTCNLEVYDKYCFKLAMSWNC